MGSFANGVHIRSDDADEVARAIDEQLREDGYSITDEAPPTDAYGAFASSQRGVRVTNSDRGWVGVLDSDAINATNLALELSRRLDTYAIQFFVNDSDFWSYLLFHQGAVKDEFSTMPEEMMGEGGFDDFDIPDAAEVANMFPGGLSPGDFQQQVQEFEKQINDSMPPEVRAAKERIDTAEFQAGDAELLQNWLQEKAVQLMSEIEQIPGMGPSDVPSPAAADPTPPPGIDSPVDAADTTGPPTLGLFDPDGAKPPESNPNAERANAERIERLRPLLAPDVADQVEALLQKRTVFAEEVLGEFLELLAIRPGFAHLSYSYVAEWSPEELTAADIALHSHLTYETDAPPMP